MRNFMHYVDSEIAKIVCKLLGRWNTKIWAQRYHYAPFQTAESVMEKMKYLFINPVEASLVEKLPNGRFRKKTSKRLAAALQQRNLPQYGLVIEPFAWKQCFRETRLSADTSLRTDLLERIAQAEGEIARQRRKENRTVCNIDDLMEQNPHKHYIPKKYGRRTACISSCPEMRAEYLRIYKDFCEKCSRAWQRSKENYAEVAFPAGAFIPPQFPRATALCFLT